MVKQTYLCRGICKDGSKCFNYISHPSKKCKHHREGWVRSQARREKTQKEIMNQVNSVHNWLNN